MWLKVKMFRYKVLLKNKDLIINDKSFSFLIFRGEFWIKS